MVGIQLRLTECSLGCWGYESCRSEGREMAILEFVDEERGDLTCWSCRRGGNRGSRDDGQSWAWWWCEGVKINSFLCCFAAAYRVPLLELHFRY